ncbi:MAG: cardiolipin synthase B, partial [Gammaproteobacteria bacterium]|nr:cardiolipin synthase B [Gammaproteobacteria bacterium]
LRIANSVGAALSSRRVLGRASDAPLALTTAALLVLAVVAFAWPRLVAWPIAALTGWLALNLGIRMWRTRRRRHRWRRL